MFRTLLSRFSSGDVQSATADSPLWQRAHGTPSQSALILLIERGRASLDTFLDAAADRFERFAPAVFVVTCLDLRPFHQRGLPVECLPSLADIAKRDMKGQWLPYLRRRHALLLAKWQPRWQLAYGMGWDAYLDAAERTLADGRAVSQVGP